MEDRKGGGFLWKQLRINGTRRYRRRNKVGRGEKIKNRVDIDERPQEVANRLRYGDWEADLIQGATGKRLLALTLRTQKPGGKTLQTGEQRRSDCDDFDLEKL